MKREYLTIDEAIRKQIKFHEDIHHNLTYRVPNPEYGLNPAMYSKTISKLVRMSDVVEKIIEHLGLEFEFVEEEPEKHNLIKKGGQDADKG